MSDHQARYQRLLELHGAPDSEVRSALYVLAALDTDGAKYVSHRKVQIGMMLEDSKEWSSGERALVKLAAHLLNAGTWPCTIDEVLGSLDERNFTIALEALRLRYRP